MTRILTELSGFGHYGVCSYVNSEAIRKLQNRENISRLWESPDFLEQEGGCLTGIDHSLIHYGRRTDTAMTKLGWHPARLSSAMRSIALLRHYSQPAEQNAFSEPGLEVLAQPQSRGWQIGANFGEPIWDIIERPGFYLYLPAINKRIETFWQDQANAQESAQCATLFTGVDGPTLQLMQPGRPGHRIVGTRNHSGSSYQLCSCDAHSATDAFAHVYALCVILDQCRKLLVQK